LPSLPSSVATARRHGLATSPCPQAGSAWRVTPRRHARPVAGVLRSRSLSPAYHSIEAVPLSTPVSIICSEARLADLADNSLPASGAISVALRLRSIPDIERQRSRKAAGLAAGRDEAALLRQQFHAPAADRTSGRVRRFNSLSHVFLTVGLRNCRHKLSGVRFKVCGADDPPAEEAPFHRRSAMCTRTSGIAPRSPRCRPAGLHDGCRRLPHHNACRSAIPLDVSKQNEGRRALRFALGPLKSFVPTRSRSRIRGNSC